MFNDNAQSNAINTVSKILQVEECNYLGQELKLFKIMKAK